MRTTTPAITQYVRQDGTVIPAVVAPAPAAGGIGAARDERSEGGAQ